MDLFYYNFTIDMSLQFRLLLGGGPASDVNLVQFGSNFLTYGSVKGRTPPPPE